MEAKCSSETSNDFHLTTEFYNQSRRHIPGSCCLTSRVDLIDWPGILDIFQLCWISDWCGGVGSIVLCAEVLNADVVGLNMNVTEVSDGLRRRNYEVRSGALLQCLQLAFWE
jgi:hypothetical protein